MLEVKLISLYLSHVYLPFSLCGFKVKGARFPFLAFLLCLDTKISDEHIAVCFSCGILIQGMSLAFTKIQVLISQIYDFKPFIFINVSFLYLTKRNV